MRHPGSVQLGDRVLRAHLTKSPRVPQSDPSPVRGRPLPRHQMGLGFPRDSPNPGNQAGALALTSWCRSRVQPAWAPAPPCGADAASWFCSRSTGLRVVTWAEPGGDAHAGDAGGGREMQTQTPPPSGAAAQPPGPSGSHQPPSRASVGSPTGPPPQPSPRSVFSGVAHPGSPAGRAATASKERRGRGSAWQDTRCVHPNAIAGSARPAQSRPCGGAAPSPGRW